jgi:hypothetical protein
LGLVGVPFLVLSITIGLRWGAVGVAAIYCLASLIWIYPVIKVVLNQLSLPFSAFIFCVYKPLLLASVIAVITRFLVRLDYFAAVSSPAILSGFSVLYFISYLLLSKSFRPAFLNLRLNAIWKNS